MSAKTARPYQVLIVDDEAGDVELTRTAFAAGPYNCHISSVSNGREALAYLRKSKPEYASALSPDIVLLDLNMPIMNGRETLKEIKADASLAAIPVIVLTTSDVERDVESSYSLGAAGFITKPVSMEELIDAIHALEHYWFGVARTPKQGAK
ncbi:MAG: response regulator [Alphaproteobacteria bacterium]|nr:response regulator [Alphaproteobacteria bacterium]